MTEVWILTYAVHSLILLGGAWLVSRIVPTHWHAARELTWKCALLVGLVSSTALSLHGEIEPSVLRSAVTTIGPLASAPRSQLPIANQNDRQYDRPEIGSELTRADVAAGAKEARPAVAGRETQLPSPDREATWLSIDPPEGVRKGSVALVLGGAFVGFLRLLRSWRRTRRRLSHRVPIDSGPLHAELQDLIGTIGTRDTDDTAFRPYPRVGRSGRTVRLSDAPEIGSPVAYGFSEICVPARKFELLTASERRAALAHELAHLTRRDPLWFSFLYLLESTFFFLPLHRIARRQLLAEAEFLCDDWAGRRTGSRLDLARCLAKVAEWGRAPRPQLVAPMAGLTPLLDRVRRLLEPERKAPAGSRSLGALVVVAFGALTLGFGPRFIDSGEAAVETPEPSGGGGAWVIDLTDLASEVAASPPDWRVVAPEVVAVAPDFHASTPEVIAIAPGGHARAPEVVAIAPGVHVLTSRTGAPASSLSPLAPLRPLDGSEDERFTVRVEGEDGILVARFEGGELAEAELDGEKIPRDRCDFDGSRLVIWDEGHEFELYSAEIPRGALLHALGLGRVAELRAGSALAAPFRSRRPEAWRADELLHERLSEERAAALARQAETLAHQRLDALDLRTAQRIEQRARTEEARRLAEALRVQRDDLERQLRDLERKLAELRTFDGRVAPEGLDVPAPPDTPTPAPDADAPDLRYWEEPEEWPAEAGDDPTPRP